MSNSLLEDVEAVSVSLSPALVVEDDPAMRERLGYVLSTLGCDEPQIAWADSVASAKELLDEQNFGVAVVISAWRTEEVIFAALRAGAIGYLLKERDDLELSIALRSIEQGGAPIDPAIARRILGWLTAQQPTLPSVLTADAPVPLPVALTPRERKILELVAQGLSNRDMAESLSISRLTVECHTKNIYRKLAVTSRTEAVYQGRRHGLLH
jgi:DNA-binding NarL/FixJ family response regulator